MKNLYNIENLEQLEEFAKTLKSNLKAPMIISLNGTLGSGKTTLVQKVISCYDENIVVNSPTFSIVNEYNTKEQNFVHIDAYRMNGFEDFLDEYFTEDNILFIEWYEKLGLPDHMLDLEINIEVTGENSRLIKIKEN